MCKHPQYTIILTYDLYYIMFCFVLGNRVVYFLEENPLFREKKTCITIFYFLEETPASLFFTFRKPCSRSQSTRCQAPLHSRNSASFSQKILQGTQLSSYSVKLANSQCTLFIHLYLYN